MVKPQCRDRFRPQGLLASQVRGQLRDPRAGLSGNDPPRRRADSASALAALGQRPGVMLAGDAAGVVAPASGEGIYYAMIGGRLRRKRSIYFGPATRRRCAPREDAS